MKKGLFILMAFSLLLSSLTGCGTSESNNGNNVITEEFESVSAVNAELSYYDECKTLPTFDSTVDAEYSGRSWRSDSREVSYYYTAKNDEDVKSLINDYAKAIKDKGFSTKNSSDEEISVIENDYIIASLTIDNGRICLLIVPENKRINSNIKNISIGSVITSNDYELKLTKVEFTYELLPPNTSGVYMRYLAESGKVYIHVAAKVKNTMQRDILLEELFTARALYDGKYKYEGFTVVEEDDNFRSSGSETAATPLETCTAHALIECPSEVESSGKPVVVTLLIGDTNYEYTIR